MTMKRYCVHMLPPLLLCWGLVLVLQTSAQAAYRLSMLPRYSAEEIHRRITPLARYLSNKTGLEVEVVLTSSFAQYQKKLHSGAIDIGFENPYIYVLSSDTHDVMAMAVKGTDGDRFRGIIISRADSPLEKLEDLKGRSIAIVGHTSGGGYLSQKLTLLEAGIDMDRDCRIEEVVENKQENVIFSVFTGDAEAGLIRESALHMVDAYVPPRAIRVLAHTAWLPNWALSVRRTMPVKDREAIRHALMELKEGDAVLQALKIRSFRPATDSEYDPVRRAVGMINGAESPAESAR